MRAILDRLVVHDEVFFVTKFGAVRGITFKITRESQVTHQECRNLLELDPKLHALLSSDGEMRSPYITFDFLSKKFEPWGASQMW